MLVGEKFIGYYELTRRFLDHYEVKYHMDEKTMSPILTFTTIDTKRQYCFKLNASDIIDFENGMGDPQAIINMTNILISEMRNEKINQIL